jgi:hypothetical protein
MDHAADTDDVSVVFQSRLSFGQVRGISRPMPEITITYTIDAHLIPLLDAMRGQRELADFLRGATELGLSELLGDAARRIADRQVSELQEFQYNARREPVEWKQLQVFLSTAPPPAEPAADAGSDEEPI